MPTTDCPTCGRTPTQGRLWPADGCKDPWHIAARNPAPSTLTDRAPVWDVATAIIKLLPIDPEDGTTVIEIGHAPDGFTIPVWGFHERYAIKLAEAAIAALLAAGYTSPEAAARQRDEVEHLNEEGERLAAAVKPMAAKPNYARPFRIPDEVSGTVLHGAEFPSGRCVVDADDTLGTSIHAALAIEHLPMAAGATIEWADGGSDV